jgi:hypothetical protein
MLNMRFEELLAVLHEQSFFDFETVSLFFAGESPASVRTSLYRFVKDRKLISLRRGLYTFSVRYRKAELSGTRAANILYQPSYLSERWALSWYGIIPEKTVIFTSVTPRVTRKFSNDLGIFQYRTISGSAGAGTVYSIIAGQQILIAEPEQALLDFWYLEGGVWTADKMESMRFEPEMIDIDRLRFLSENFHSKTIDTSVRNWKIWADSFNQGMKII